MGLLSTEGFDRLLENVAAEAAERRSAADAVRHLATIGGRLASYVALGALRASERHLLDALEAADAAIDPEGPRPDAYRFGHLKTGKACLLPPGAPAGEDVRIVGAITWPDGVPEGLQADWARLEDADAADAARCLTWLREQGETRAQELVARLRHLFQHVGPIRLYVGDECYTNLGREGNLVGKSIKPDSDRCRMKTLAETPLVDWSAPDACFVVCMNALIDSGTPSRTEEFSGTQLLPGRLERFLQDRVNAYGGHVPATLATTSLVDRLFALAERSRELRVAKLASGATVYRTVQAMTINKREHFFAEPITGADVPGVFADALEDLMPGAAEAVVACESVDFDVDWRPVLDRAEPLGTGFGSRFEEVLHGLVGAAAAGTRSDVAMSRGPRDLLRLADLLAAGSAEPGHWKTSEYYCCVVPSEPFRDRLAAAGAAAEVPQVVRAIAARMRWNCWHFMPHGADVTADPSLAERDWFFAPSMPDMTEWTSHHHQGHVANGVRHAIRVPFGVTLAGAHRPGTHDLRLMRSEGDVFGPGDLRAAIAMGAILQGLYQQFAARVETRRERVSIDDFGNPWYQNRYGVTAPVGER